MDSSNQNSPLLKQDAELAAAQASQPSLFAELPDALQIQENRREYTGKQLLERKPQVYRGIVTALGEGMSIRQIARALEVSHHTVIAVRDLEPHLVATLKKDTARRMRTGAALAVDRIIDEIEDMPRNTLPIVAGILTDKAQLLDGEATARIEHKQGPTHEDYLAMIAAAEAQANANAIEVETLPATGSDEEKTLAKGAVSAPDPLALPNSTGDSLSSVFVNQYQQQEGLTENATTPATTPLPKTETSQPEKRGGEGVEPI